MSEPLRIAGAQDLFAALRDPDMSTRWSVLRAIARNPAKAVSYGPWEGRTLQDELLGLWEASEGLERMAVLGALLVFPLAEVFLEEFWSTDHRESLMLLAHRLKQEPAAWLVPRLCSRFLEDGWDHRQQVVANMLSAQSGLPPVVRLRVALLSGQDVPVPPWDADLWLPELSRPTAFKARAMLEELAVWEELVGLWARLPLDARLWLLDKGHGREQAFEDEDERVLVRVLELGEAPGPLLERLVDSANGRLRELAVLRGAARTFDEDPRVRVAILRRCEDQLVLTRGLLDADWGVRGAAVERLRELGWSADLDLLPEPYSDEVLVALEMLKH